MAAYYASNFTDFRTTTSNEIVGELAAALLSKALFININNRYLDICGTQWNKKLYGLLLRQITSKNQVLISCKSGKNFKSSVV